MPFNRVNLSTVDTCHVVTLLTVKYIIHGDCIIMLTQFSGPCYLILPYMNFTLLDI
jgi:hypothetical protein